MDPSAYKDITTTRGLNYHYYFSPPTDGKPVLVFVHGFPSTSYDWRYQVAYFKPKGYGIIVPDMLGYGGTAKPTNPAEYKSSLIVKDILDILDTEKVEKAVFIGHDWGSRITSRIVQYSPERVIAFGILAVSYQAPSADFDWDAVNKMTKEKVGYELLGYWGFFAEEGADKIIEDNFEKFMNIVYPENPKQWITDFIPLGAHKAYLTLKGRPSAPLPSWMPAEEFQFQSNELRKGGLAAPLCWYKVMISGIGPEDDKGVPAQNISTSIPAFFGAALEDYVALAALAIPATQKLCSNLTVKEFQANHWVQLHKPAEVNDSLGAWLESVVSRHRL
ncbi:epoxide hydrolase [Moniliophthora roreri MCA 2997]|uniref:Epoxide hydrolase n=1 Tax=Moniliophthora roreri (strain MCA 2997) TaxID=1381753 RepID=V2W6S8_MONRO|nr:epoxide hydrolase [Moniliophthora roreri MCA 2997]